MNYVAQDGDFSIIRNESYYEVLDDEQQPLITNRGHNAKTKSLKLAKRLMADWKDKGYYSYPWPDSILSYHFMFTDNFSGHDKKEIKKAINTLR